KKFADDVTDITRIGAGDLLFDDDGLDLVEVVRDTVARLQPDIVRSGSTVSIEAAQPVLGRWSRVRLEQVISNLVINSLKFGLGRSVGISVSASDGWATLVVSDQGLGVPESLREAIFRPFERAVSVHHYGGLGLGLFIVRTIVRQYDGTVQVEPGAHRGS